MRVLLQPRDRLAYGQDFHNSCLSEFCGLTAWQRVKGRYNQPPKKLALIVSQNPDDPGDSSFVSDLGRKIPTVVHLHCRWNYFVPEQQQCAERAIRHATIGIVPAEFLKQDMALKFDDVEWHVVSNGVSPKLFHPTLEEQRKEFRRQLALPEDTKLIGIVGRLENAKGAQIVRKIAEMLKNEEFALFIQYPNWETLQKASRDTYTKAANSIRKLNPEKIIIFGDLAPGSSDRPIKFLDGLLMPSLSEVQPLVVLEALMSGVPVVATRSTPFYEVFNDIMSGDEINNEYISEVPLPSRFEEGLVSRPDCVLTATELGEVSEQLVPFIRALNPPDDIMRERLAAKMIKAGFTQPTMNSKMLGLYERAIAAGPKTLSSGL